MSLKGKRYAVLSFDTESDLGSWSQEYTSIDKAVPLLLDLLDEKQINATFLWEGEAALHNPDVVKETYRRGYECGLHTLKHETIGKAGYSIPGDRVIRTEEFEGRLRLNKKIIWDLTKEEPVSFRAPRLWTDATTLHVLESVGIKYDSSYPIATDDDPLFPYFPSKADLSKEGDSSVLQMPVAYLTESMMEQANSTLRFFAKEMPGGLKNFGQWPILRLYGGEALCDFFDIFAKKQEAERGFNFISIYQHPWEYIRMPGILSCLEGTTHLIRWMFENSGDFALNELGNFIDSMHRRGFEFLTMTEAGELWKEANTDV